MKKRFLFVLLFVFLVKAMAFDPTGCDGSCEVKLVARTTVAWCLCCCASAVGKMIPSEKFPLIKEGFFPLPPEKELALGVVPWLVAGVPCAYLGIKSDGHSCCLNNARVVCKRGKDHCLDFYREILAEAYNYFCPIIEGREKED